MHILVTNDNGINAPGLLALAQAMRTLGDVSVRNWTACGQVKTLDKPLRVRAATLADGSPALTSDGAPSDCVALALLGVLNQPPDLIAAGINSGENVEHAVTYSDTVTAAMEAAIWGLPGVAVSLQNPENGALMSGYVSVAPIQLDLTAHAFLDTLRGWTDNWEPQ